MSRTRREEPLSSGSSLSLLCLFQQVSEFLYFLHWREINAMHRHAAQTLAWSVLVTGVVAGVAGPAERSIFGAAVRRCGWVLRLRGGGTGNLLERRRVVHECAEEQELQVHADRGRRASRIA